MSLLKDVSIKYANEFKGWLVTPECLTLNAVTRNGSNWDHSSHNISIMFDRFAAQCAYRDGVVHWHNVYGHLATCSWGIKPDQLIAFETRPIYQDYLYGVIRSKRNSPGLGTYFYAFEQFVIAKHVNENPGLYWAPYRLRPSWKALESITDLPLVLEPG